MRNSEIKELLKEKLDKFKTLYSQLKRAKNKKDRENITKELDWQKRKMIKNFDLTIYDKHINHYSHDDSHFENDVEEILSKLKE